MRSHMSATGLLCARPSAFQACELRERASDSQRWVEPWLEWIGDMLSPHTVGDQDKLLLASPSGWLDSSGRVHQ